MKRILVCKIVLIIAVLFYPAFALSEETYKFNRMWPTLKQPWYFFNLSSIAADDGGNIYVADIFNNRVQKFTSDGTFISTWGSEGSGDGEFQWPHGIAIDQAGDIYVVDNGHHRVQKFASDGTYLTQWGNHGSDNGEFNEPRGIATDADINVYVADMDNHRIQKFASDGTYVSKWGRNGGDGTLGSGDGEFNYPYGIATDQSGDIYVADTYNHRIQKFTSDGTYISKWGRNGGDGTSGSSDGEFDRPKGITVGADGNIYVADTYNDRLQKFTSDGNFITTWELDEKPEGVTVSKKPEAVYVVYERYIQKFTQDGIHLTQWKSFSSENGEFDRPKGIAMDAAENIYVADTYNHRIQKLTSDGTYITQWGSEGSGDGEFDRPKGIAMDAAENIYVADTYNHRIQKFASDGTFIDKWGSFGLGDGRFNRPKGIAVNLDENVVYVVDNYNDRIQKFGLDGTYIDEWGSSGSGDGEFIYPEGIAVDGDGNVYVADTYNHRIQKFAPDGTFIDKWGSFGSGNGEFRWPNGVGVDADENTLYVVDNDNNRIQKFGLDGAFILTWGSFGSMSNQLSSPTYLSVGSHGKIYVADTGNDRIQVFKKSDTLSNPKAILVAGGGAFPGNSLWDATQVSANFAYRTLIYQGFAKDDIFYLTSDTDLDFDGDGIPDANGDATNANLQSAITGWAVNENADSLVLYLVDHGGEDTFRMSGSETFSSENLANWLNQLQANISGRIVVIYDACKSGSFIDDLKGDSRIIITSTLPNERAKFLSQGTISFSNFFWTHIFNGLSIEEAFVNAKQVVNFAFENQNPMLSGAAENVYIDIYEGSGVKQMIGEAPDIGSVSQPQDIEDEISADLYADGVDDPDGVARVWATVWPPGTNLGSAEIPLLDQLPTFELVHIGGNSYKGTYGGFTQDGSYQIAIYAMDGNNNTSIPKLTSVSHNYHLTRKAIIVAGGESVIPTRSMIETNAGLAYNALLSQLYTDDDIYFMSVTGIPGFDVAPSNSNLENHINSLAGNGDIENLDLTIYMIGAGDTGIFTMNDDPVPDILNASSQLDVWLDNLQSTKSCRVTLIYDADKSGSFIPVLYLPNPPQGKERILITSSSDNGAAYFSSEGDISFSSFFWSQVSVGAILYDAFAHAKKAISYFSHKKEISFSCYKQQGPLLEADGDDAGNEESDYQVARTCTIGIGIKFADDPPQIGSVSVEEEGGVLTISAEDITSTKDIQVWAIIKHIRYCPENSNKEEAEIVKVVLDPDEDGSYEYTGSVPFNCYQINVYATDIDNNTSLPKETKIYQTEDQDIYEVDNTYLQANVIVINHLIPQPHNFHYADDKDWIKFYGREGEYYTIEAGNLGTDCEPVMELYAPIPIVEDTILNNKVTIDFECLENGIYYVRLLSKTGTYGENTEYDLRVDNAAAGDLPALITGSVMNQLSWQGIDGAIITIIGGDSTISVGGKYDLYQKPGGGLTMTATAVGYVGFTDTIFVEAEDQIIAKDIMMNPIRTSECITNSDCDDGLYCNGTEMCIGRTCSSGITLPCPDDELFCNGEESCDEENDICLSSGNPCAANLTCDEENDVCVGCLQDADCDDQLFCNGDETCVEEVCQPGTDPCSDDGLFCNGEEICDEGSDTCLSSGDPCPEGTTCVEEDDRCAPPPPEIVLTPDSWFQSRWVPVLIFLGIEGSETHFDASTVVNFNPAGSLMALPLVFSKENISCIGLLMPQWLTGPLGGSVDVTVTTGSEEAFEALNIELLPFILNQEKDLI